MTQRDRLPNRRLILQLIAKMRLALLLVLPLCAGPLLAIGIGVGRATTLAGAGQWQAAVHADLIGSDRCAAGGTPP